MKLGVYFLNGFEVFLQKSDSTEIFEALKIYRYSLQSAQGGSGYFNHHTVIFILTLEKLLMNEYYIPHLTLYFTCCLSRWRETSPWAL